MLNFTKSHTMKKLIFLLVIILFVSCKPNEVEITMNQIEQYKEVCYNDSTAFVFVTSTQNIDTDTTYKHKTPTLEGLVDYLNRAEK